MVKQTMNKKRGSGPGATARLKSQITLAQAELGRALPILRNAEKLARLHERIFRVIADEGVPHLLALHALKSVEFGIIMEAGGGQAAGIMNQHEQTKHIEKIKEGKKE